MGMDEGGGDVDRQNEQWDIRRHQVETWLMTTDEFILVLMCCNLAFAVGTLIK